MLAAKSSTRRYMSKFTSSPARLEAFSDGVIAVIITIMVLELKVPTQSGLAGLLAILPTLAIYLLSFTFTGIYWINHHHLVHRIREADQRILYANLGFLFCLSLIPFFTSYLIEKEIESFSVALYAVSMIVIALSFLFLRLAISRRLRLEDSFEQEDIATQRKHWMSLGLYLIAVPLSFYHPYLALAIIALVMIVWIIPTARIGPCEEEHPKQF